jgi:uncharacterized protein
LSDEEIQELHQFLALESESEDVMPLDVLDGYLHAIAIGPTTLYPSHWLPQIWGTGTPMPRMKSVEDVNHLLNLIMRHYNSIIAGVNNEFPQIAPLWPARDFRGKTYEIAEGWALGFVEGMQLCFEDWKPMFDTPEGPEWFRPIALLARHSFEEDPDKLTSTPARRAKLAKLIPEAVLSIHLYWLSRRNAPHEKTAARRAEPKVGRNDFCPCGSGKKFKRCCGSGQVLH